MVKKIGILGGRLSEMNPAYPYRKWMDDVPDEHFDGDWILNEPSLVAAIEHKYKDAEVVYLKNFNEKTLQKNDVNFLVGVNLLNAWHTSPKMYEKWLKIMKINVIIFILLCQNKCFYIIKVIT